MYHHPDTCPKCNKPQPSSRPNVEMTKAVDLPDVEVRSTDDKDAHVSTHVATLTFGATIQITDQVRHDRGVDAEAMAARVMRDSIIDGMLAYIRKHDSSALDALLSQAKFEGVREYMTLSPTHKKRYPSDRGKPGTGGGQCTQ